MLRLVPFQTESLRSMDDGRPAAMFEHAMQQAIRDCFERPGNKAKRNVNLTVSVVPVIEDNGECERVKFFFECQASTPKMSTKEYEGRVTKNGAMLVSQEFPDNVDQHSLLPDPADNVRPSDGKSSASGE